MPLSPDFDREGAIVWACMFGFLLLNIIPFLDITLWLKLCLIILLGLVFVHIAIRASYWR